MPGSPRTPSGILFVAERSRPAGVRHLRLGALREVTGMTAHVTMRKIVRLLRDLEASISAQRKFIVSLEARGLDTAGERQRLAELLAELDAVLHRGQLTRPDVALPDRRQEIVG
jgi:hypothetical protein